MSSSPVGPNERGGIVGALARPSDWLRAAVRGILVRQYGLTPGELRVLECLAEGKSTEDVRTELSISRRSVEDYVRDLLGKLDARNRAGLIACWLGLVYQAIDTLGLHLPPSPAGERVREAAPARQLPVKTPAATGELR
jgi:DNA-binding CsgD family transcriptional regulator